MNSPSSSSSSSSSYPVLTAPWEIPIDYEITKSPFPLSSGDLTIYDAAGNLAFRAIQSGGTSSSRKKFMTLFNSSALPLFTIIQDDKGEWKGYRGSINECQENEEVFKTRNISNSKFKTKIDVYLTERNSEDPKPSFRLTGNPFRRACTITERDNLVAQTNLLYKLRKIVYSRRRFRLTVYPRNDHVLVLAMLVTFFWNYS